MGGGVHLLKIYGEWRTFHGHQCSVRFDMEWQYPLRSYVWVQQLCEDTGCCPEDLLEAMNDREKWRERVRDIRATSTTWWWWWWWDLFKHRLMGPYAQKLIRKNYKKNTIIITISWPINIKYSLIGWQPVKFSQSVSQSLNQSIMSLCNTVLILSYVGMVLFLIENWYCYRLKTSNQLVHQLKGSHLVEMDFIGQKLEEIPTGILGVFINL